MVEAALTTLEEVAQVAVVMEVLVAVVTVHHMARVIIQLQEVQIPVEVEVLMADKMKTVPQAAQA